MGKKIELQTVLKELHNISGFRISIHDTNLNEICAYPETLSDFCALIQENPEIRRCCVGNDARAFEIVKNSGDIYIYQCQFGLFEAVAPLYHFGVLAGFLMMGQTIDTKNESRNHVYEKTCPYIQDKHLLQKEIDRIPTSSREKILSCISIMNICAEYISLSNRLNITDNNLADKIKEYINENYASKITIELLCNHFFYSKPTIINTFKKAYHISVNQYLTKIRLEHGADLLKDTSNSIYRIAKDCGFNDQNYFSKAFSKEYSMTPSQYRKNSRESQKI